jgi:hypothetical protein
MDRSAGMEKIILPEFVTQALANSGKQSKRKCSLTSDIMLWVVLAMGLFTELAIRQVFKVSRRLRKSEPFPTRSTARSILRNSSSPVYRNSIMFVLAFYIKIINIIVMHLQVRTNERPRDLPTVNHWVRGERQSETRASAGGEGEPSLSAVVLTLF